MALRLIKDALVGSNIKFGHVFDNGMVIINARANCPVRQPDPGCRCGACPPWRKGEADPIVDLLNIFGEFCHLSNRPSTCLDVSRSVRTDLDRCSHVYISQFSCSAWPGSLPRFMNTSSRTRNSTGITSSSGSAFATRATSSLGLWGITQVRYKLTRLPRWSRALATSLRSFTRDVV